MSGKVAIVTGGSRGMGAADVRALVTEGASVVFTDLLEAEGQALAKELGGRTRFFKLAVFLGMKAVVPSMKKAGGGSIINISSMGGIIAFPNILGYVASKWAVRGMTKAAAQELAKYGIRVNSVHPGIIAKPMTASESGTEQAVQFQPIARKGRPEEVANMVLYLASDESSYSTGVEFVVDGGFTSM